MSELFTLGVSHHTAPLELRERLALTEGRAVSVLGELKETEPIYEAAAISTCNRTELYLVVSDPVAAESRALGLLAREAGIRPIELVGSLYSHRGAEVAEHLFRVACGLESMILGEAEIQGQVKRAAELALVEGASGPILNRMFHGALSAGKRVRGETKIGRGGVSVPSAAVELARRTLGDLTSRRVLLIGAGDMAELTAKALAAKGVEAVFVANRHHDRAISLAQRYGGEAVRLEALPEHLRTADIVVSVTNSPHHIIEREGLADVIAGRETKPLLILDLAVPRDVDPDCRELPGVTVYDVDGIQEVADRNASRRDVEARHATRIVESELVRFHAWHASLEVQPTLVELRSRADQIVERVLAENSGRWESLGDADAERVELLARAIASRLLHEPTMRLKRLAEDGDPYLMLSALQSLFGLDSATEPESEAAAVTPIRRKRA